MEHQAPVVSLHLVPRPDDFSPLTERRRKTFSLTNRKPLYIPPKPPKSVGVGGHTTERPLGVENTHQPRRPQSARPLPRQATKSPAGDPAYFSRLMKVLPLSSSTPKLSAPPPVQVARIPKRRRETQPKPASAVSMVATLISASEQGIAVNEDLVDGAYEEMQKMIRATRQKVGNRVGLAVDGSKFSLEHVPAATTTAHPSDVAGLGHGKVATEDRPLDSTIGELWGTLRPPDSSVYGSVAHLLPPANDVTFHTALRQAIEDCRVQPDRLNSLSEYVQTTFVCKKPPTVPRPPTQPAAPSSGRAPTGLKRAGTVGSVLFPTAGKTEASNPIPVVADPTSGGPNRIDAVRAKKLELDLQHQRKCEAQLVRWRLKVEKAEESGEASSELQQLQQHWLTLVLVTTAVPMRLLKLVGEARRSLRKLKKEMLVQQFVQKMMAVVRRRRARRIRVTILWIRSICMWFWLHKKCSFRRYAARLILSALKKVTHRKPTLYYLKRFYAKVLKAQYFVRSRQIAVNARMVWFLMKFLEYELKTKGSALNHADPAAIYPNIHLLGGKSVEETASLCAKKGIGVTMVPLEVKLHVFRSYWRHFNEKYIAKRRRFEWQQRRIRRLCLDGMSYPQAKKSIIEADREEYLRPYWPLIPTEASIATAYTQAQKKYFSVLKDTFIVRRANHGFLNLSRYLFEVFHTGISQRQKAEADLERRLIEVRRATWIYSVALGRGDDSKSGKVDSRLAGQGEAATHSAGTRQLATRLSPSTLRPLVRLYAATFPPILSVLESPKKVSADKK